jgi:hypothetical protein
VSNAAQIDLRAISRDFHKSFNACTLQSPSASHIRAMPAIQQVDQQDTSKNLADESWM